MDEAPDGCPVFPKKSDASLLSLAAFSLSLSSDLFINTRDDDVPKETSYLGNRLLLGMS